MPCRQLPPRATWMGIYCRCYRSGVPATLPPFVRAAPDPAGPDAAPARASSRCERRGWESTVAVTAAESQPRCRHSSGRRRTRRDPTLRPPGPAPAASDVDGNLLSLLPQRSPIHAAAIRPGGAGPGGTRRCARPGQLPPRATRMGIYCRCYRSAVPSTPLRHGPEVAVGAETMQPMSSTVDYGAARGDRGTARGLRCRICGLGMTGRNPPRPAWYVCAKAHHRRS
jgi:hypothetical protein